MYAEFWKLRALPFENTPDPRFLYASLQHEEGLARLRYVIEARKGAGVLTGVFGCGKTLLARAVLGELSSSRYRSVYLANPLLSDVELLHAIAQRLHVPSLPDARSEVLADTLTESIGRMLVENARDGKDTVIVIDEAHLIQEPRVLEQLRLLLNFQDETRFLLTLILMGQPELRDTVDRNKPLAQRICLGHHLGPLAREETSRYVAHRLAVAGAPDPAGLFTEAAVRRLHESSGGIPRRINQLADLALLSGMHRGAAGVDEDLVAEALESAGV
ncbi:MAG TPA: AAA family ATPase [bacterium]